MSDHGSDSPRGSRATGSGTLSFRPAGLPLPVLVFGRDMKLRTRTTASDRPLPLPEGSYFVVIPQPAGGVYTCPVAIRAGEDFPLDLLPALVAASQQEWLPAGWRPPIAFQAAPGDSSGTGAQAPSTWDVRYLSFGIMAPPAQVQAPQLKVLQQHGDVVELEVAASTKAVTFAQFRLPGRTPLTVALPVADGGPPCRLLVSLAQGRLRVAFRLENPVAEAAAAFLRRARVEDAGDIMKSTEAQDLLFKKITDPLGAILGAHILLRVSARPEVDLAQWLENLVRGFDWIPDGHALLGELHSRHQRQDLAFECYTRALERGLPFFTDTFSRLVSGMRRLARPEVRRRLGEERPNRANDTFDKLRSIGVDVEFSPLCLTLTSVARMKGAMHATRWRESPLQQAAAVPPPALAHT